MFTIVYKPNGKFNVVAPDGEIFFLGVYNEPYFFQWQNKYFVAVTHYFDGETSAEVKELISWKTSEHDMTKGN